MVYRLKVDPKQQTKYSGGRHYSQMNANSVSRIVMYVSEVNDAYRRENAILRILLLEQGLYLSARSTQNFGSGFAS